MGNELVTMEAIGNYADKAIDFANVLSAVRNIEASECFATDDSEFIKSYSCVEEFLNSPLGDETDRDIKKIYITALAIAKSKGLLEVDNDITAEALASTADDMLTRVKVTQQIESGVMDAVDAIDALVDRGVAHVQVGVDLAIDKYGPIALQYALKTYPKTARLATYAATLTPFITPVVKKVAHTGLRALAEVSKAVVRVTASTVVNKIKNNKALFA